MALNLSSRELERGDSSPPLYQQLKSNLLEKISNGDLEPGEQLPTEHRLCEIFSISRTPVRQALKELVNEGVLSRRQGSGTYVNETNDSTVKLSALVTEREWVSPLKQAVKSYNERSREAPVALEVETLGRPHFYERIVSAVGRGEAPDLALMDSAWVSEFAAYHFIESLETLDDDWTEELRRQLLDPFVDRNCYQGEIYALQPETNVSLLWYRRDIFDHLGLSPPKSWSELVKVGLALKDNGWKTPLVFPGGTAAGETTTYQLLPFIWSAGGAVFKGGRVALEDGGVEAVQFLVDLVHRHGVAPGEVYKYSWDGPIELFAREKVPMAFGGSYEKKRLTEDENWGHKGFWNKVGWTPLPGPSTQSRSATAGGMVYVVLRQANHPKIAAEVLKEVMDPDSVLRFCSNNNRIPTTKGTLEVLNPEEAKFSHQISSILDYARTPPGHVRYASVSEQLQLMLERAILQQMTPAESVEKAAEVIRSLS